MLAGADDGEMETDAADVDILNLLSPKDYWTPFVWAHQRDYHSFFPLNTKDT
jgi:hypothetical protein